MNFQQADFRGLLFALLVALCVTDPALAQINQKEPPATIRKVGGVLEGSAIKRVEPTYPPLAKAARISGSVFVEVMIDETGVVISDRALSGHPLLKDAAVTAAQSWRFGRAELSGVPVKVIGTLTFNFQFGDAAREKNEGDDIVDAKKAVEANPRSAEAHLALGAALADDHRYEEAIASFKEAVLLNPDYKDAYLHLALALHNLGRHSEETTVFKQALEGASNDVELLDLLLGALLGRRGKALEAEAEYRLVLQLKPDSPSALNNLGYSMVERNESLTEALKMIQRAVDSAPENGSYLDSLGWAYFKLGKLDEAERWLKEAALIVTSSPGIHEHLGDLYQRRNKPEEARAAWAKALSLSSEGEQVARLKSKLAGNTKK